jgi:putative lipoic acid-binding regulatory protein
MQDELLSASGTLLTYTYVEMLANMGLAAVLGFVISAVYRFTHKGLSYSQSFTHTILFVTVIVSIVMMVIGGSLARAFALVGALSIIRFRTVIKDTKDTAYVFVGLAVGMAAGTSNYFLAVTATGFVSVLAMVIHKLNYGALYKSEFILRFMFDQSFSSSAYLEVIQKHSKRSNMLHIEPSGDGNYLKLTYDIILNEGASAESITQELGGIEGVSEVVLIASKSDVDY